jgi:hypothetical protein
LRVGKVRKRRWVASPLHLFPHSTPVALLITGVRSTESGVEVGVGVGVRNLESGIVSPQF